MFSLINPESESLTLLDLYDEVSAFRKVQATKGNFFFFDYDGESREDDSDDCMSVSEDEELIE